MRLLVVEDEALLREQLVSSLTKNGYAVDSVKDGEEGLFQIQEFDYDLAVIDLGLPKIDGISLVKKIRKEGQSLPILILTARGDWQDKVSGLEAGADDYLTKPFMQEELQARLNALLRRSAGQASVVTVFGPVSLDSSAKKISLNDSVLELTSFEYKTAEYLMLNAGKVVSKTELVEHIYDQDFDRDSNVIEVFVGRLRKKLDPDNSLKPIGTVRGQGYRFDLQCEAPNS
jgi:two-component system response regulator PhoP